MATIDNLIGLLEVASPAELVRLRQLTRLPHSERCAEAEELRSRLLGRLRALGKVPPQSSGVFAGQGRTEMRRPV